MADYRYGRLSPNYSLTINYRPTLAALTLAAIEQLLTAQLWPNP